MPAGHSRSTNLSYILPPSFTQPNLVRFFPLYVKRIDVSSARSIINLSWDRFLRAAFDRKPIARRGRLLSKTPSAFLFPGNPWRGKHKLPSKPLSYPETLSRLNETFDGFNRWPSARLPPFSSSTTFLQNWFSLTNPVEDTARSPCYPSRTTREIRERYVTISNRI